MYAELSKHFMVDFDETGSIGKRYRRQDEIGTPFCITFDFDSVEDKQVTVRDRDTMEQLRMPISELKKLLRTKKSCFKLTYKEKKPHKVDYAAFLFFIFLFSLCILTRQTQVKKEIKK
ncbi:hypothetical protein GCM10020331_029340 [Ectobacillus funiculus]